MRFSVHLPTAAEGLAHPVPFAKPEDLVALAIAAERLGYDGVWGNHHVTTQQYVAEKWATPPNYYDPLIVLAVVGAQTRRLHLGTALLLPQMYVLPTLAKQVATLDQLCGGRLRLGLGIGAYREEFDAVWPRLGGASRGEWLEEATEGLLRLFGETNASFDGKYVAFRSVKSFPKPAQQPFPIYIGGHNEAAIRRAARWGNGWLPGWQPVTELARRINLLRDLTAEIGRPSGSVEVAPQFSVTIGKSHEEAETRYWRSGLVQHRLSLAYTGRDLSQQVNANLVGDPDEILGKVEVLSEIGVEHCCALWFSTDTVDEMVEQMQWFAEAVITRLRLADEPRPAATQIRPAAPAPPGRD